MMMMGRDPLRLTFKLCLLKSDDNTRLWSYDRIRLIHVAQPIVGWFAWSQVICLVPISISGVRIQPVKCPPNRPIHSVIHCANIELTNDRRWLFYSQVFSYLAEFSIVCRLFVFGVPNANYKLRWLANRNRECNTAFKVHCGRITGSVCASEIFKAQVIVTLPR